MDIRLQTALLSAKASRKLLRRFGSGATAAPGLVAQYIDKDSLRKLAASYPNIILVSGTNGKTTTSRLISAILEKAGLAHIDNREGSNLTRGLITSLASYARLSGKPKEQTAIFEVDEAALPYVVSQINPKLIVLTNLFRDQLDRYGEVDTIRRLWLKSVENLDSATTLLLNADDPGIASLTKTRAKVVFFGLEDPKLNLEKLPHAADFINCTNCGSVLNYSQVYLSHLGAYRCSKCPLTRPNPQVSAGEIHLNDLKGANFLLLAKKRTITIESPLPGLYNLYNALAASTLGLQLGIAPTTIKTAIGQFKPAFGRTETFVSNSKKIFTSLVKNPTGFNEVIRTVFSGQDKKVVLIAINDLIADGRDVSWLWDVDFEPLAERAQKVFVSGLRAADMQLRLKYAGAASERFDDLEEAAEHLLAFAEKGETVYLFPTYTALIKLKAFFAQKGLTANFWED
ncbi:MAG: hypothetical protein A3F35_01385 [Candidatus Woykebacteria bacterium RIFCSPHIGHO2_12_FULL_45_10]|uniref:Lipid II isoglutaminyl synthase (glutamine-hydrolyzing) subunit MurT n=1 Tax=Candidatus Woykebacteria bacterium RIFCSPHIGHO2_12_FULL_45_10 TaxID=1802603 RepID=A0A1G1WNQ3_9BACT|nr:MAG: hypothetical protein A3F35_01385 [Candidatus Woykebacteria bacterium RIFCSPHIGHO2_12_FULL_45_10]